MPPVIAGAGAFLAQSIVVSAGYSAFVGAIAGALAGAVLSSMFTTKPKQPGFSSEAQDRNVLVRSAVQPRRIVYGETVTSGPIAYMQVTREYGSALGNSYFVVPFTAPYTVSVQSDRPVGSVVDVQVGVENAESISWTSLSATAGAPGESEYSRSGQTFTFNAALAGRQVQIYYYYTTAEVTNSYLHIVVPVACHEVEEISDVFLGADTIAASDLDATGNVVSGKYAHNVRIKKHLGTTDQEADADLVAESAGQWTSTRRGRGIAYVYIRLRRNLDLFPNGLPNIRAKVKGAKVYDPRTGLTAYSNNWALCVNDYLRRAEGLGCAATEIDADLLTAAANEADEDVEIDASATTQKRYTIDGTVNTADRPLDILRQLLSAGAGTAVYSASTWDLYAGVYHAPTVELTVSDLRGPISGRADLERRDLFNGVRGTIVDEDRGYQPTSFPPVTNATYVAEDNDEEIYRDIELPFTQNAIRAQRLAKIFLERARQATQVVWPGKPRLFRRNTWETANVTVAQLGWNPKVMRIAGWKWQPGGGVDYILKEEAAGIYDWAHGEATTYDYSPNTSLTTGVVGRPGAPVVSETLVDTTDGQGIEVEVTLSCTPSTDAFVDRYQFEYKLAASADWTVLPSSVSTTVKLRGVVPGDYDWRVRGLTTTGRSSLYSQTRQEILGGTVRPAAPTGLSIQAGGGTARLKVDQSGDLDVRRGGRVLVRHCHEGVTAAWESSFSIGEPDGYPGASTQIDLPLKPGTYLVKFRDCFGNESESYAEIETKQASVLAFSTLATVTFDPDFSGTHSGTAVADGELTLGGVGLFDDIPDFDAVTDLDGYGGIADDGTWTAATGMDLASVSSVRLTSRVEGAVNNLLDQIDDREGNVDDWLDWDGSSFGGSAADAWMEVRETDVDPASAVEGDWSAWKRLDSAEFSARAFQFRARLTSSDAAYRPLVGTLRATAEEIV
jgi:hypothetical protein